MQAAASEPGTGAGSNAHSYSLSESRATVGSERSVVQSLCGTAGGLRPQPSAEQLRTFLQQAAALDPETIALELSQQLVAQTWQSRVRALAAIQAAAEAVAASGGDHPLALAVASLASVPETFDGVLTHSNPTVRQAARSCAAALGFPAHGGPEAAAAASVQPASSCGPAADLLGGGADPVPSQAHTAAATSHGSAHAPDLLDLMDGPTAQNQTNGGSAADDLLGGLDNGGLLAAQQAPSPAAPVQTHSQAVPVEDMFAGLNVATSKPERAASGAAAAAAAVAEHDPFADFEAAGPAPEAINTPNGAAQPSHAANRVGGAQQAPSQQLPCTASANGQHGLQATAPTLQLSASQPRAHMQATGPATPQQGYAYSGPAWGTMPASMPPDMHGAHAGVIQSQLGESQNLSQTTQGLALSGSSAPSSLQPPTGAVPARTLPAKPAKKRDAFDFVNDMVGGT